jgi:hypothetical protein
MKHIMLKDLAQQKYILVGGIIVLLGTSFIPKTVRADILLMLPLSLLLVVIVLGVLMTEAEEEKNYGYTFLSTLPISRLGVIGAKFLSLLLECALFSTITGFILMVKDIDQAIPVNLLSLAAISFGISLTIGGVMLSGIYIFGLKHFTKGMLVLMLLVQVYVFILSVESFAGKDTARQVLMQVDRLLNSSLYVLIGIPLLIWSVLLGLTAQFRKKI